MTEIRGKCKLDINNAKRIRHYWQSASCVCDCGSEKRVYIRNMPFCFVYVQEIFNDLGYSINKNYVRGDNNEVRNKKN
jgi:hypothetical protein